MNNYNIWPPIKGKLIMVKKPNFNIPFIGKVYKPINNGCIILLMNNGSYIENDLNGMDIGQLSPNRQGILLLRPEYNWNYLNDDYLNIGSDKISDINYIANKYMNFKNNLNKYQYGGIDPLAELTHGPHTLPSIVESESDVEIAKVPFTENIDEAPRRQNDCSGLKNVPLDYVVSKEISEQTHQPEPLMNDLFTDKDLVLELTDINGTDLPEISQQGTIRQILTQSSLPVNKSDLKLVVSPLLAVENVIRTVDEELGEANKIISWLETKLNIPTNKGVNGLLFKAHKGYVHVFRKHIGVPTIKYATESVPQQTSQQLTPGQTGLVQGQISQPQYGFFLGQDTITEANTPGLKYFKWQYGLPIDYDTLKYVLFQNKFQENLVQDKSQLEEAKRILAQEYLIAFQPEPLYVMWFAKRLIECWYADDDLNANIRKIKILVNLYRARNNDHNRVHGVLPIIVIYPKYGATSAEIVIKKLLTHFWKQIPVGWKCSHPTYFVRLTDFLYYTNGAIDLKLYHRKVLEESKESLANKSFGKTYTRFENASDLGQINVIDDITNQ